MIWRNVLTFAARGRLPILIFHRVLREPDPLLPDEPSATEFDALLRHIKSRFHIVALSDAVGRLVEHALPAGALAVTFDDGYADNLSVAAPLLRRHGVPATVFISTGYLEGSACMWNDVVIEAIRSTACGALDLATLGLGSVPVASIPERRAAIDRVLGAIKYLGPPERDLRAQQVLRAAAVEAPSGLMLTPDSVRSLADWGLEVGAHTIRHPILAVTPPEDAWREIHDSKRDLERTLGRTVSLFAYPNGVPSRDYSVEHVRMVREAGFAAAVTTAWGAASDSSDVLQLPRFTPWTRQPLKFDLLMLRNLRQGFEVQAA